MTQQATAPNGADPRRPLSVRVSLGRVFKPVPIEFLLIASAALLLTGFGIMMVISATTVTAMQSAGNPYNDGIKHAIFAAVGIPLMFVVSGMRLAWLQKLAWPALIGSLLLQLLVFTPLGHEFGGNRNWLKVVGQTVMIQPSEFIKLALVVWIAAILCRKRKLIGKTKHLLIPVVPVSVVAFALVMAGHDLGTTMILALIVLGCLFFAGARLRVLALPLVIVAIAAAGYVLSSENRMRRVLTLTDDCLDRYTTECFQPLHGIWGLASGGFLGLGLGNSTEKYEWLPAAADDYIFAIVGEELGLLGCLVVLLLFGIFSYAALRIVRRSDDLFVKIAAGGVTVWIVGQGLVNIGVVLRIFPPLGVPLPFLSSGGSALIAVLLACGVLLACARTLPQRGETAVPSRARIEG
jgi:cell division protein FtsW